MGGKSKAKQALPSEPIGLWSVSPAGSICVLGTTIASALASAPVVRDLDVAELWSGVASIAGAADRKGYKAVALDLHRVPGVTDVPGEGCEDITPPQGFDTAINYVLRLREGGLCALGPDCSSFTFPNSSNHKRTKSDAIGALTYKPVAIGNLIAVIALFLCQLCMIRRVHFALENPPDSHMFSFFNMVCPDFMSLGVQASQTVHRCPYDDAEEPRLFKFYKWIASWLGVKGLNARCQCKVTHTNLGKRTLEGQWSGDSEALLASAAYPVRLGEAMITMWEKHCAPLAHSVSKQALSLQWVDPRGKEDVEKSSSPAPCPAKAAKVDNNGADFGPWGSSSCAVLESGRRGVSGLNKSLANSASSAGPSSCGVSEASMGPWSQLQTQTSGRSTPHAPSLSSSNSTSSWGPWAATSATTSATEPLLGPWGNMCPSSEEEPAEEEPEPGQIGEPRFWR